MKNNQTTVNRIDELLYEYFLNKNIYVIRQTEIDCVKDALYKEIMECLPEEKEFIDAYGTAVTGLIDPDKFYVEGFNSSISEIRKFINELFGKIEPDIKDEDEIKKAEDEGYYCYSCPEEGHWGISLKHHNQICDYKAGA